MGKLRRCIAFCLCAVLLAVCAGGCGAQPSKTEEKAVKEEKTATVVTHAMEDVKLNSGYAMPRLGLGTWTLSDERAEAAVYEAIKDGYRLIDTARYYGNERGVGNGVRRAIADGLAKREDLFITSKIMPGDYRRPDPAIDDSLAALGLGYIDLMLIHQPGAGDEEVYQALERGVKAGKIRSIGISNYYAPEDFERIHRIAEIVPAVVQNENHPFYQNTLFQEYVSQYGTAIESWYPLGGRGNTQKILGNSTIRAIAEAHGKTAAQVVIRWHLQAGYIVIPGSGRAEHIKENMDVFDFELTAEEMKKIAAMDKHERFENW